MGISATRANKMAAARVRTKANLSRDGTRLARKIHNTSTSERPKPTYTPVRSATSRRMGFELGNSRVGNGGTTGMGDGLLVIPSLLQPAIRRMVARFRKNLQAITGQSEANLEADRDAD